jgi:RNA polymerase sigma-70 factor (ECF subfamily)
MIATETAALVTAAVAELPLQQRTVLALRVWNGLSYTEIAQVVGRTEATVRSHMFHGLATLRRYLEPRLNRQQ